MRLYPVNGHLLQRINHHSLYMIEMGCFDLLLICRNIKMLDMMIGLMLIDLNMLNLPVYWFHSIMVIVYCYIHYVVLMNGWMCSDMPYGYPKYYMGLMIWWRSYEGDRCPKRWFSRKKCYFTKWDFVFLLN